MRLYVLGLASMIILQGCGLGPSKVASTRTVMATPTLEAMPTATEIPPTSTPVPVVQPIEPTPDPFTFLFEKFEMKTEMEGWGTTTLQDLNGNWSTRILHTSDGGLNWLDVTPPYDASTNSEDDIDFFDGGHAWIVADAHSDDEASYFPIVWQTLDGGMSWEKTEPPISFPYSPAGGYLIEFQDLQHGRLDVIKDVAAGTTFISSLETSDGGRNWRPLPDTDVSNFGAPHLLSEQVIPEGLDISSGCFNYQESQTQISVKERVLQFFCNGYMLIYHSHDGGKTWGDLFIQQPLLLTSLVDFVDTDTGWYRGIKDDPSNTHGVGLYVTHDGGATWNEIHPKLDTDLIAPEQIPNDNPLELIYDIDFFDLENGIALSDHDYEYSLILKTADGGLTWSAWVPHWQPAKQ